MIETEKKVRERKKKTELTPESHQPEITLGNLPPDCYDIIFSVLLSEYERLLPLTRTINQHLVQY